MPDHLFDINLFSKNKPRAKKKREKLADSWLTGDRRKVLENTGAASRITASLR